MGDAAAVDTRGMIGQGIIGWSDDLIIGVDDFDIDHEVIFRVFASLGEVISMKRPIALDDILAELIDHSKIHFAREEYIMCKYGFPDVKFHVQEHDAFIFNIQNLQENLGLTGSDDHTVEAFEIIRSWMIYHINGSDRKCGAFLGSRHRRPA